MLRMVRHRMADLVCLWHRMAYESYFVNQSPDRGAAQTFQMYLHVPSHAHPRSQRVEGVAEVVFQATTICQVPRTIILGRRS